MTAVTETAVRTVCPVCDQLAESPFAELRDVPVHTNVLWESLAEATTAPRSDVILAFCERCGLIWNVAFDSRLLDYDAGYENSLHFSPMFQRYADALADRLVERHSIRDESVVEIGCGKGEFLALLAQKGASRLVGFDPSYDGESDLLDGRLEFVRDVFTEDSEIGEPALVVCRHVLEHIEHPLPFLQSVRHAVKRPDAVAYFEVPAAEHLLRERAVWDVIYPHVSVFGEAALRRLFEQAGFRVLDSGFSFGGQYLWIEAAPNGGRRSAAAATARTLEPLVAGFQQALTDKLAYWERELAGAPARTVALWGAGAKASTFLNVIANGKRIERVVDVNPRKHGLHVPGTGHRIEAPAVLAASQPARVLMTNPMYCDEIRAALETTGASPRLESI